MIKQEQMPGYNDDTLNENGVYQLRLFVTGASPNSTRAIANLKDNYELEIIDVYQQPTIAETEQIIALPLLIKKSPSPERRLIGDMSDTERVLRGLGLPAANL
jgi:circadian clock protein KaiB